MFEKMLAKRALYKAGYNPERIEETVETLLSPKDGILTLDKSFFKDAPKGIGKALAKILPSSSATELRISKRDWNYEPKTSMGTLTAGINARLNFDTFGARYALADVIDALPKTSITSLSIKSCEPDNDTYKAFARSLEKSKLKSLYMEDTDIANYMILDGMLKGICSSPIEKLSLPNNNLSFTALTGFAVAFSKGARIKELDLSFNNIDHIALGQMAENLPPSVETLKLNDVALIDPRNVKNFAEGLVKSGHVKHLELRCTGLDNRTLPLLFPAFQNGVLQSVDLSGNSVDDKTALALADALSDKKCTVCETKLGKTVENRRNTVAGRLRNPVSESVLEKVYAAERANADKQRAAVEREQAFEAVRNAGDNAETLDPFTLAKAGQVDVLIKQPGFSPSDFKRCDEQGKALIVHVAESGALAAAFTAPVWKNPKEMQETWDLVPAEHKRQMDGQDGRPLFQHVKNKVMADFVRNNLKGRSVSAGR